MKNLLLIDFENVQRLDMSLLNESYQAIVFIGALQNTPRAAAHPTTAHRFSRVQFQRVEAPGRNSLDFHIACHLGRIFETERETHCIVVSKDKGYDPLLVHLNRHGLSCRRIEAIAELAPQRVDPICRWCHKAETVPHHGGLWCANCARFATPPNPELLPSNQPSYWKREEEREDDARWMGVNRPQSSMVCGWCNQASDMAGGIYGDGEWMCGICIARYAG